MMKIWRLIKKVFFVLGLGLSLLSAFLFLYVGFRIAESPSMLAGIGYLFPIVLFLVGFILLLVAGKIKLALLLLLFNLATFGISLLIIYQPAEPMPSRY